MGTNISRIALVMGGGLVSALGPEFVPESYRWPLFIAGLVLIAIGIMLPWILRLVARLRPPKHRAQLYLYTAPVGEDPDQWKGYWASWSPTENFGIAFSNHAPTQIAIGQNLAPKEKGLTLHLFNAGPDDVRHITLRWSIPGFNVVDTIKRENLFDGFIFRLEEGGIQLVSPKLTATRPFRNPDEVTIPVLKAHDAIAVRSPDAFTSVLAVACLAIANEIGATPPLPEEEAHAMNAIQVIERHERPIPPVTINIEYTIDGGAVVKQAFIIRGRAIRSGFMRKVEGQERTYDHVPDSICGGMMYLQVMPQ